MAEHSKIEWTDATWNPITGCSIVSPGCTNCYAMRLAATRMKHHPSRADLTREVNGHHVWTGNVRFNAQWLDQPIRWRRPRDVFVCAHGDLFHESVPDGWIMQVLRVMGEARQHRFQILTKRSARMRDFFRRWSDVNPEQDWDFQNAHGPEEVRAKHQSGRGQLFADMLEAMGTPPPGCAYPCFDWAGGMSRWPNALPNVWLGVSAERQKEADERIPDLLDTPAAVRFLSAEPLLGPINLRSIDISGDEEILPLGAGWLDRLEDGEVEGARLDWVIVGGESGRNARPMHPAWARALRDQCAEAGVAFFFKQWGEWAPHGYLGNHDDALPKGAKLAVIEPGTVEKDPADYVMLPLGKKAAGRLLDGVEHSAMPERRAA